MITYLKILVNRKKTNNENDKGKKRTQTIRIKFQVAHNISTASVCGKQRGKYIKKMLLK